MSLKCPKCGNATLVKAGTSPRGKQRYAHDWKGRNKCRWHGTNPVGIEAKQSEGIDRESADALHRKLRGLKVARYVITAAQNATPVNERFLESLFTYCKDRGAELIVIPYRYKNPTSWWSHKAKDDDWWAAGLAPYLLDRRVDLNPNLILLADIKTQPTASRPLQGFETMTGEKSAIVGHPKLELITVPTPQSKMAKIMTTTGAVTKKNYIPGKAGKKGEFHHTFGACVVEVAGGKFHMRQINAVSDGSFIELDSKYDGGKITRGRRAAALVMGDTHVKFVDPNVVKATFDGPDSIVSVLKPREIIWHDTLDFYNANHHHRGDVFTNYVKHHTRNANVERELDETIEFIDRVTPRDVKNIFVASNHPDAFGRWIKETDPRTDPENCVFWARTFQAMCEGSKWTNTGADTIDPFAYWALRKLKTAAQALFLSRGQSYLIRGIDVSHHGDIGSNGARGSISGFGRVGVKTVIGHGHSPGIRDGAMQVGTNSRLGLNYQRGAPSSWLQTDAVIYENGKRSLINIIGDDWRA